MDGDESDGDDDEGRARKKVKIAKAPKKEKVQKPIPAMMPALPGAVPEKRKRGRPRKVPLPPAVPPMSTVPSAVVAAEAQGEATMGQEFMQQNPAQAQAQGQATPQYLLAAFAFFSVWNSPFASSYTRPHAPAHAHAGAVLTEPVMMAPPTDTMPMAMHGYSYGVHEMVQAFHLLVSTLVFFYIVFPWLSGVLRHNTLAQGVLRKLHLYVDVTAASHEHEQGEVPKASAQVHERVLLAEALAPSARGLPNEADRLRKALGVSTGVVGLVASVVRVARVDRGLELNQLEQRAWTRLGELVACNGESHLSISSLRKFAH